LAGGSFFIVSGSLLMARSVRVHSAEGQAVACRR
jgi:hypothetical protein